MSELHSATLKQLRKHIETALEQDLTEWKDELWPDEWLRVSALISHGASATPATPPAASAAATTPVRNFRKYLRALLRTRVKPPVQPITPLTCPRCVLGPIGALV